MTNPGIDYGPSTANIDIATGIRYGVISINSIDPETWENRVTYDYDSRCPQCGGEVVDYDSSEDPDNDHLKWARWHDSDGGLTECACRSCEATYSTEDCTPDEPSGAYIDDGKYIITKSNDLNALYVIKSPYVTYTQFCSPCCPGAGDLDNPLEGGVKTYCLGPDWFEGNKAPYQIEKV
jgi:hypothetical protein